MTAGNIKFLLLHSGKGETEIKNFFQEVHDLFVKVGFAAGVLLSCPITNYGIANCGMSSLSLPSLLYCQSKLSMNPFYRYDTPITSKDFDQRVRAVARRNLL